MLECGGAAICILWLIQGKFSGLVPLVLCSDIKFSGIYFLLDAL
jgi:hypothetical protein